MPSECAKEALDQFLASPEVKDLLDHLLTEKVQIYGQALLAIASTDLTSEGMQARAQRALQEAELKTEICLAKINRLFHEEEPIRTPKVKDNRELDAGLASGNLVLFPGNAKIT
jgi:hypothetical protein